MQTSTHRTSIISRSNDGGYSRIDHAGNRLIKGIGLPIGPECDIGDRLECTDVQGIVSQLLLQNPLHTTKEEVEEAKEAANEELKAGLAAAEEALAAAEEVAAIEIKGWRDAADAIFSSSLNMSFLDSDQDGLDRDDPLPVHVESLLKDKTVAAKIDKIVAKEKKYEYEIADSNGAPELRHAPSLTHSRSFSSRIGRALIPLL